jgi:hypothetical protein
LAVDTWTRQAQERVMDYPYPVPHHAKMRRIQDGPYQEAVVWTWEENGQQMGYKVAVTPGMFTEVHEFGSRDPILIPNYPIQAPPPPPPHEPASLFSR